MSQPQTTARAHESHGTQRNTPSSFFDGFGPKPQVYIPIALVVVVVGSYLRRKKAPTARQFIELAIAGLGLYGAVILWQLTWGGSIADLRVMGQLVGAVGIGFIACRTIFQTVVALWSKEKKPDAKDAGSGEKKESSDG